MAYHQPFEIAAFHSCDREVGLKILNGQDDLRQSNNTWDWLGPGIYFWEQNPDRALEYAIECASEMQKFNGVIKNPFVIGALIELGNCLNLLEPVSIDFAKKAHKALIDTLNKGNEKIPTNKGPNRALDCAVIKYLHKSNEDEGLPAYDTVRSSFWEGTPIYDSSSFTDRLHIEICVLNPSMIKGYFLPRPIHQFNPYMLKDFDRKEFEKKKR